MVREPTGGDRVGGQVLVEEAVERARGYALTVPSGASTTPSGPPAAHVPAPPDVVMLCIDPGTPTVTFTMNGHTTVLDNPDRETLIEEIRATLRRLRAS